jgi:hypothetical protein
VLGAPREPQQRVTLSLCASEIDVAIGSLLTNSLRRYADAKLLNAVTFPCMAVEDHCRCTAILPALKIYQGAVDRVPPEVGAGFALIPHVQRPSATSVDEFIAFHHRFATWMLQIDSAFANLEWSFRQAVTEIAYHAVQNVFDHAYRKPFALTGSVFSFVVARKRHDLSPEISSYAERIGVAHVEYLDLTINDDGVGIPARQAQDDAIYWSDVAHERSALASALTPRSTAKLFAYDANVRGVPGLGTSAILRHVRNLEGYATLRTGRLRATIDGTVDEHYQIDPSTRGYVPGTLLNIIVPLPTTPH